MNRLGRAAFVLASALTLGVSVRAVADPTPQEAGWTARKVADGFGNLGNGLAYDPVSTDLFATDWVQNIIYRVTQAGVKTAIYSASDMTFDELAFDPTSRIVYFGGVAQTVMRKITENGTFLEDVTVPFWYSGMAFAPDGKLYVVAQQNRIARYNESDDSFTVVCTGIGSANFQEGLAFDPSSNAYGTDFNSILRVDPSCVDVGIGTVNDPMGVTFGDGSVLASSSTDKTIYRLAPNGGSVTAFATSTDFVHAVHFGSNGRLYANYQIDGSHAAIWEFTGEPVPVEQTTWGAVKNSYR